MSVDRIERELATLTQTLDSLPEIEEPPPTTLQILGRSRREGYWHAFLEYFLSPLEAHGLETDLLCHVLDGLVRHRSLDFSYSRLDIEDIQLASEVATSEGRPDMLIWADGEWFICLELKVDSSEGTDQTQRYVDIESFDEIDLEKSTIPNDNHYYVYLSPQDSTPPDAPEFTQISWEWVASHLQTFLTTSYGQYPSRTTAQLTDFIDTIRTELTMTDYQENRLEKVSLVIEHYDSITEVFDELERYTDDLQDRWPDWFIEQDPDGWDDTWHARASNNSYMSVHRPEWAIGYPGDDENNKDSDFHLYWEFRTAERYLGANIVNHRLIVTGQDFDLIDSFKDDYYSEHTQERLAPILADLQSEPGKDLTVPEWDQTTYPRILDADYSFEFENGAGFERTVAEAFGDLHPVFDIVTELAPTR